MKVKWVASRKSRFYFLNMKKISKKYKRILILDNIRSNHNVGSIFRTADASGIDEIYLIGYTPSPIDRFNRAVGEISKTALGAEKTIPWKKAESIVPILKKLKKDGFEIIALEQSEKSVDYKKIRIKGDIAVILGNEVGGIDKKTLNTVDYVAEIPMLGEKESLNVSVATGVLLFRLFNI